MAFKMKGMYFGEGTGSAMKKWPGAPVMEGLIGALDEMHGLGLTGDGGSGGSGGSGKEDDKEEFDAAKFNAVSQAGNIDWSDLKGIELENKTKEAEDAKNTNKEENPDPSVGHTPQTVQPIEEITPQTVEPVEDIKPQTVTDKETNTTDDNNQNSKNEKEEIESPLKNYKKGYYGIK